jgi:hypothetical protein
MTLPDERTRSVIQTREFLRKLASPYGGGFKKIPTNVRKYARALLRHYPTSLDLLQAASGREVFDLDTADNHLKELE